MTAARARPDRAALRRKALRTAFWFLASVLLFNALFGDMGLIQGLRQRRTAARLRAQVEALRAENAELRAEIEALGRESSYRIEAIAREDLGLSRPGEIVFLFQDESRGVGRGAGNGPP
ncbi:MAG: septum formation initiator family protein [Acidobacteriota bacterium]